MNELDFIGAEDISPERSNQSDVIGFFDCPDCGETLAEWCDCPVCGWYDSKTWEETMSSPLSGEL